MGWAGPIGERASPPRRGARFWSAAAEAGRAVLERCRRAGYPFVTATHDVHNPHSGRVMQKLGMIYRYSYQEQWQPKDIPVTFRMYQLNFDGNDDGVYRKYWDSSEVHFVETFD